MDTRSCNNVEDYLATIIIDNINDYTLEDLSQKAKQYYDGQDIEEFVKQEIMVTALNDYFIYYHNAKDFFSNFDIDVIDALKSIIVYEEDYYGSVSFTNNPVNINYASIANYYLLTVLYEMDIKEICNTSIIKLALEEAL